MVTRLGVRLRSVIAVSAVIGGVVTAVQTMGCFPGQTPGIPGIGGRPTITIEAPTIDVKVPFPNSVQTDPNSPSYPSFVVRVAYTVTDPDGDPISLSIFLDADRTTDANPLIPVDSGLNTGKSYYDLDVKAKKIPAGSYYILLVANDGSNTVSAYALGMLHVQDLRVNVLAPASDVRKSLGGTVDISFEIIGSAAEYTYELFYVSAAGGSEQPITPDGNGDNTAPPGERQDLTWTLSRIGPGSYRIGVRVRDDLGRFFEGYAPGNVIIDAPQTVLVNKPSTRREAYLGEDILVEFRILDTDYTTGSPLPSVQFFLDTDFSFNNGFAGPNTAPSGIDWTPNETLTYMFDPEAAGGALATGGQAKKAWYVGVAANDGVNPEVAGYSPARVVLYDPDKVFSNDPNEIFIHPEEDPNGAIIVLQGELLNVEWKVTAPANGGDLVVEYEEVGGPETGIIYEGGITSSSRAVDTSGLEVGKSFKLKMTATLTAVSDPNVTIGTKTVDGPTFKIQGVSTLMLNEPKTNVTVASGDTLFIKWTVDNLESTNPADITGKAYLDPDTVPLSTNETEIPGVSAATPVSDPNLNGAFSFSVTLDLKTTEVPFGNYYLYLYVDDDGRVIQDYAGQETGILGAPVEGQQSPLYTVITVKPRVSGTFWMGNAGRDLDEDGTRDSLVFAGFDFYDSAGSLVAPVGDFDGDGFSDFLVVAQFAKPYRTAPVGDAYLIYGNGTRFTESVLAWNLSTDPNIAILSLNSVGSTIRGALFVGPQQVLVPDDDPKGIQSAAFIPDLDDDGVGEIAFGMPYVHNSQSVSSATSDNRYLTEIVRAGQMRRGAVVIARSMNNLNQSSPLPLEQVIRLDEIGQHYSGEYTNLSQPSAEEVSTQDAGDITLHYIRLREPDVEGWSHPSGLDPDDNDMAGPRPVPTLGVGVLDEFKDDENNQYFWDSVNTLLVDGDGNGGAGDGDFLDPIPMDRCLNTGYLEGSQSYNYGSRIVGDEQDSDFGATIDWWRGALVASSPTIDPADLGFAPAARAGAGVVYVSGIVERVSGLKWPPWERPVTTAKPSNLVMSLPGDYGHPTMGWTGVIIGPDAGANLGPVSSLGEVATGQAGDFNGDGLDDLAIGAPGFNGGAGAGYVFYVRMPEPFRFDLAELNLGIRTGVQINGNVGDALGTVVPSGVDFNADGFTDAVFGNPGSTAGGIGANTGQVILFYGGPQRASPAGGWDLDDIAYGPGEAAPGDPNKALGVVFNGISAGDEAGAAAAAAGDFDGDGVGDLVIAAPSATPQFDSDGDGTLDTNGIDLDGDGVKDDVNGDGVVDAGDDLTNAGVVYLIYGQRNKAPGTLKPLTGYISLADVITGDVPGVVFVGKASGDALGGGMTFDGVNPGVRARGFSTAGDVDGDGRDDILISSVSASPLGNTNAGEVYLIYGAEPQVEP